MPGKRRSHGSENKAKNAVKPSAKKAKFSDQSPLNLKKSEEFVEYTPEGQYKSLKSLIHVMGVAQQELRCSMENELKKMKTEVGATLPDFTKGIQQHLQDIRREFTEQFATVKNSYVS